TMDFYFEASSRSPAFSPAGREPALSEAEGDLARITRNRRFVHLAPSLSQVVPIRVHRLNQLYLLTPPPTLDLLLAVNRRIWIEETLVVSQSGQVVSAGEAGDKFVFVFKYAAT